MKELKTVTTSEKNLLEVRKETLKRITTDSIRPHGKLWGMDVFSWANPDIGLISSTIHSFPFPVVFVAPSKLTMSIVEHDQTVISNIHAVVSYEDIHPPFNKVNLDAIEFVDIFNNVKDALNKISERRLKRGVVLFCYEGLDVEHYKKQFNDFLELHQQ